VRLYTEGRAGGSTLWTEPGRAMFEVEPYAVDPDAGESMSEGSLSLSPYLHLLGRLLFAALFVTSGINHLTQLQGVAGYAQSKGVPAPRPMTVITGVMMLVGGVLVALGWQRGIGAGLIFVALVPITWMMHAYWKTEDPMLRGNDRAHFMKNVALAGAALLIAFYAGEPWPLSLGK
jgi:putative oxidoreductase